VFETKIVKSNDAGDGLGRRTSNQGRESSGRRGAGRDSLFLMATIRKRSDKDGELIPVRVRNLSPVGLMADYQDVAEPDEPVIVTVRGIGPVAGKVAWLRRGRIGVTFDTEVDPLLARKPVGGKAAPGSPQRRPL
jgi:hypothetical protein